MFQSLAKLIDRSGVRLALMLVGLALTLLFIPILAVGLIGGALDIKGGVAPFVVACCSLAGISCAWVRVALGSRRLRKSPVLHWSALFGLLLGTSAALWLFSGFGFKSGSPVALAYLFSGIIGIVLLLATLSLPHEQAA